MPRRLPTLGLLLFLLLPSTASAGAGGGVVTLIIDDLGYDLGLARRTLALPPPFAVAVLPDSPHARRVSAAAAAHDTVVLLHLPMSVRDVAPGSEHVLTPAMSRAELTGRLEAALRLIPEAIAVNNHEGSELTADPVAMGSVMSVLARNGPLAFVDSRTSAQSVAEEVAMAAGLATTRRDVFLDHDPRPEAVAIAVRYWIDRARDSGCALAIGHPRSTTLEVLEEALAGGLGEGIDRVDLPTYIERCGHRATGAGS